MEEKTRVDLIKKEIRRVIDEEESFTSHKKLLIIIRRWRQTTLNDRR